MRDLVKSGRFAASVLVMIATALVAVYHSPLFWVPRNDAQVYLLAGKVLSEGGRLYLDFFDHKGPFFLAANALGWMMTGNEWGIWTLETLLLLTTLLCLFRALSRFWGVTFSLAYTLGVLCIPFEFNHPDTLTFELALFAAAILMWRNLSIGACAFAGVCAAFAFLSKLTCVAPFAAFALFLLLLMRQDRAMAMKRLVAYVLGGVVCLMFVLAILTMRGELAAFWQTNIVFNLAYGRSVGGRPLFKLFQILEMMGAFSVLGVCGACGAWASSNKRLPVVIPFVAWLAWELLFLLKGLGPWPYQLVGIIFWTYAAFGFVLYAFRNSPNRKLVALGFMGMMLMTWATSLQAYKVNNAWDANLKILSRLTKGARLYLGGQDPIPELEDKIRQLGARSLFSKMHQCRLYFDTNLVNPLAPYYYYGPMATPGYLSDNEVGRLIASLKTSEDLVIVEEKTDTPLGAAYLATPFAKRYEEFLNEWMTPVEFGNYRLYVRRKGN